MKMLECKNCGREVTFSGANLCSLMRGVFALQDTLKRTVLLTDVLNGVIRCCEDPRYKWKEGRKEENELEECR